MLLQQHIPSMHLNFKRRTIFLTALTFVPLIALVLIFNHILRGPIQDQLISETASGINDQINDSNRQISQIENYALNLSLSLDVSKLPKSLSRPGWDSTDIRDLTNQLGLYANDSTLLDNTFVYVASHDPYLIDPHGTDIQTADKYAPIIRQQKMKTTSWINAKQGLFYVETVSDAEPTKKVYLVSQVNRNLLKKGYAPSLGRSQTYLNIDNKRIIGEAPSSLMKMKTKQLPQIVTIGKHRYHVIVQRYSHSQTLWSYFALISLDGNFSPITSASLIVLAVSIAAFVAMLGIANMLRRTLYNPVRRLVALAGGNDVITEDEVDYLQNKFQNLLQFQNTSAQIATKNQTRLKTNFVIQALQGRFSYYDEVEFQQKANKQGITLDPTHPFVFINIQLTDTLLPKQSLLTEDIKLSTFMLNNVVSDVANECFSEAYIVNSNDTSIRLFAAWPPKISEPNFANRVAANLNHFLGRWVTITTTKTMSNWHELKDFTAQLDDHRYQQKLTLENQFVQLDDSVSTPSRNHSGISEIAEKQIIENLKNGESTALAQAVNAFLRPYFEDHKPQLLLMNSIKQLYLEISHLLQHNDVDVDDLLSEHHLCRQLESLLRIEEVQHVLVHALLHPAMRMLADTRNKTTQHKINAILEYLQSNFSNPDVYLEQIAMEFGIDTYILSRDIKQETGMSFLEYLTHIRIEQAKIELRQSDKMINEIAHDVGYQPSYFNRVFKRKLGITPGEFRKVQ